MSCPELSGKAWVSRFPTDKTTAGLELAFRRNVQRFITAMEAAGIKVKVNATRRPRERAYLMHWAWRIVKEGYDVRFVPKMDGVDIQWDHGDPAMSKTAAREMVKAYGLAYRPSLTSRHIADPGKALAIDMSIDWTGVVTMHDADGNDVLLSAALGTENNPVLHRVGASYGVHKLVKDPPHWSSDGR